MVSGQKKPRHPEVFGVLYYSDDDVLEAVDFPVKIVRRYVTKQISGLDVLTQMLRHVVRSRFPQRIECSLNCQ